jgi:hypothetical protein
VPRRTPGELRHVLTLGPAITVVVGATCTDDARDDDLIRAVAAGPADATTTERLLAAAGRTIHR